VKFCIASGEETPHERNLPYAAAMACAHGLPLDQALRSVTLSPAEIMGVSDQYGALEKGKSATLIITSGNPLEVSTQTSAAFIDGRAIDLSNKQSELAKKYRAKYRQQKAAEKK
jgi:imidazolonepropionase-like amidohydrolase